LEDFLFGGVPVDVLLPFDVGGVLLVEKGLFTNVADTFVVQVADLRGVDRPAVVATA
jgi:hypothetical protein